MRWCFLDRIDEVETGVMAVGRKGVASSEDYFVDHFPGFPVVPGVVQIEALAQLSGKLIEMTVFAQEGRWTWPILSMVRKAKFRKFVRPGDTIRLQSRLTELRPESAICAVEASVGGKRTTQAEILFVFNPGDLDTVAAQIKLEEVESANLRMLWDGFDDWLASLKSG